MVLVSDDLLEPRSGKVLRTEAWSNSTVWSGLFPTRDGGYVVWHDLELSLHAADGTTLKTLTLDPNEFPRGVSVEQSPSGNTLFAEFADRTGHHILRIRVEDLQMLSWLHLRGYFTGAGSDSYSLLCATIQTLWLRLRWMYLSVASWSRTIRSRSKAQSSRRLRAALE